MIYTNQSRLLSLFFIVSSKFMSFHKNTVDKFIFGYYENIFPVHKKNCLIHKGFSWVIVSVQKPVIMIFSEIVS